MLKIFTNQLKRLHHDNHGQAIVFIALVIFVLVAFAVVVINTGARVHQKIQMQTAADAAAYSGAAVKAKGMNMIVFVNIVMVLIMSIIVLLKFLKIAVDVFIYTLLGICVTCAWTFLFTAGLSCAACGLDLEIKLWWSRVQHMIDNIIKVLEKTEIILMKVQKVIAKTVPAWAMVESFRVGKANNADLVFWWPPYCKLPAEKGSLKNLCNQVATYARNAIKKIPVVGNIIDKISIIEKYAKEIVNGIVAILCDDKTSFDVKITTGSKDCVQCRNKREDLEKTIWKMDLISSIYQVNRFEKYPISDSGGICNPIKEEKKLYSMNQSQFKYPKKVVDENFAIKGKDNLVVYSGIEVKYKRYKMKNMRYQNNHSTRIRILENCPQTSLKFKYSEPDDAKSKYPDCNDVYKFHEVYTFDGCIWKEKKKFKTEFDQTSRDIAPAVLPKGINVLREAGELSFAAFAYKSGIKSEVLNKLFDQGNEGSRIITFAEAEFYNSSCQAKDADSDDKVSCLWDLGWKARLVPFKLHERPGGYSDSLLEANKKNNDPNSNSKVNEIIKYMSGSSGSLMEKIGDMMIVH